MGRGIAAAAVVAALALGAAPAAARDDPARPADAERALADLRDGDEPDLDRVVSRLIEATAAEPAAREEAIRRVLALFAHGDERVLRRAARAGGRLAAATSGASEMRAALVTALGALAVDPRADRHARLHATAALTALGAPIERGGGAVGICVDQLINGDDAVAAAAVALLADQPRDRITPILRVRLRAALEQVAQRRAQTREGPREREADLDEQTHELARRARRLMDAGAALEADVADLGTLAGVLRAGPSPRLRAAAARLIAALASGDDATLPADPAGAVLRDRLVARLEERSALVREELCLALGSAAFAGEETSAAVARALDDPAREVRRAALESLIATGRGSTAVQEVAKLIISDDDEETVRLAREAKARIHRRGGFAASPERYSPEWPIDQKLALVANVVEMPTGRGFSALVTMLDDPDPGAREAAAVVLRREHRALRERRGEEAAGEGDPFGYRFDDREEVRRAAGRSWRAWLEANRDRWQ